jgi:hypothetical protein
MVCLLHGREEEFKWDFGGKVRRKRRIGRPSCRWEQNVVTLYVSLWTEFGLVKGFTSNYSSTANLHTIQLTIAPAKLFSSLLCLHSRSLTTASNSGDSSASRAQILASQPPVQNWTELNWTINWLCPLLIISRHGPHRKHGSCIVASYCCVIKNLVPSNGNVFTEPLPRNVRCLQSHRVATGLYATILKWNLKKQDRVLWPGLFWCRIEIICEFFWTR